LCREDDSVALDYFLKYVTRPDREVAARSYRQLVRHGLWRIEYEEAADAVPVLQGLVCGN
jgi:hypothetical protein